MIAVFVYVQMDWFDSVQRVEKKLWKLLHVPVSICFKQFWILTALYLSKLLRLYSNELDTTPEFPAIYRQEPNKLTDEELLKILSEYRKPDKFSKFTVIPGSLKIKIEPLKELPESMPKNLQIAFFLICVTRRLPDDFIVAFETVSSARN